MNPSNWSSFTKRIPLNAPIEKVYEAWATQDGLEKWFLRSALFSRPNKILLDRNEPIQKDDSYTWLWYGYPDEVVEKRQITEANGVDLLQFTFSGNCLVTVSLKPQAGLVICELTQENIPNDPNPKTNLYVGCGEGWTFYLANLKSILEGGVDLRNKDNTIISVINS